jgi:hypothetical protein
MSTPIVLTLIVLMLVSSLPPAKLRATPRAAVAAAAPAAQTTTTNIFLPVISTSIGAPNFVISYPPANAQVSGTTLVFAQPLTYGSLNKVSFSVGSTVLGSDDDGSDGFSAFLDASKFPAGALRISAVGEGPLGSTTETLDLTVVAAPPSQATIGSAGGTLGTASGATVIVPPGALEAPEPVRVRERDQGEVTAETGIEWDDLGVTFLGDLVINATQSFSRPVEISTVGYGNRVQPNQAVVTYNLLPDQDGDGVGELVVASGAQVAPNGTIVSVPAAGAAIIGSTRVIRNTTSGISVAQAGSSGIVPGNLLEIDVSGFNLYSALGNVGIFRSTVNGSTYEIPGIVTVDADDTNRQIFSVQVPPLPAGGATLTLLNSSSGNTTTPISLQISAAGALDRPASEIIDDFFARVIAQIDAQPADVESEATREAFVTTQSLLQGLYDDTSSDSTTLLTQTAQAIINSGALNDSSGLPSVALAAADLQLFGRCFPKSTGPWNGRNGFKNSTLILLTIVGLAAVFSGGTALIALGVAGVLGGALREALDTNTPDCPEPPPCAASGNAGGGAGGGSRGIGGAPPPGGNGCGNVGGGGGSNFASLQQLGSGLTPGRYVIKIFPQAGGSTLTPFTGSNDAGGYFFVPMIPAGEAFRAVAIDTETGATREFLGIGPALGESLIMNFDFSGTTERPFAIAIDDTVSNGVPEAGAGNIESPGALDIYTFTAEADRSVFFDVLSEDAGLVNTRWKLEAPDDSEVFEDNLRDSGLVDLPQPGIYKLTVGDDNSGGTGTYSFKLQGVPLPDRFTINIGDTVSSTVPGNGSGNIEEPYVKDIYSFTATAGQRIFFDAINSSNSSFLIDWKLRAPDGSIVREEFSFGDVGPITLATAGTYDLIIYLQNEQLSTYSFKLWNVPADQSFSYMIGNTVADGVPGAGAGNIETPGVVDRYTFTATAGQRIFFDFINSSASNFNYNWQLLDSFGNLVVEYGYLGDIEPFTLTAGGSYTLIVDGEFDTVGTYSFKLWNVPAPQSFAYTIGNTISSGVPGAGAGNIETPGVEDRYTFTATAGQRIYFDFISSSASNFNYSWKIVDSFSNTVVEYSYLGDIEPFTLEAGGSYTLIVDGEFDTVGTYSIRLLNVAAPQTFSYTIGNTVSNGVPAAGAGNIEAIGVEDRYTFTAAANQRVFFDYISSSASNFNYSWKIVDATETTVVEYSYLGDIEPFSLDGGTYTLIVDGEFDTVGTYSFKLWNVPAPDTSALTLDSVTNGNIETPGVEDRYTFSATAGQQVAFVYISSSASSFNYTVRLLDGNGNEVIVYTYLDDFDPVTLSAGGNYTLVVDGEGETVGTYSFQLTTP